MRTAPSARRVPVEQLGSRTSSIPLLILVESDEGVDGGERRAGWARPTRRPSSARSTARHQP
jgi:hypothetical protein